MNVSFCRQTLLTSLLSSLLGSTLPAAAADLWLADAGSVMRQSEQSLKPHLPGQDTLKLLSLPPPMPVTDQIRLHVRRVYFQGNRLLTKVQLYPAVQPYLNRPLNAADVNHLLEAVTMAIPTSMQATPKLICSTPTTSGAVRFCSKVASS